MKWTAEREEKLKQLWKKGHSGSQIAHMLGEGATRNSVLGKAFRLKLQARAVTKKNTLQERIQKMIILQKLNLKNLEEKQNLKLYY